jgi:hypothetical protein
MEKIFMAQRPLMPKATAVWLVENTKLTFEQIADFCGLHPLEVKGIADGDVAQGIKGLDPVASGQLTRETIERAEANPTAKLTVTLSKHVVPPAKPRKGPRYTPVSRRQDRPDAIYWLIRNHPELTDAQVSKLVGTTKATIESIRGKSHWNSANLKPVDPVTLGLCSQLELDLAVQKAAAAKARETKPSSSRRVLRPTSETLAAEEPEAEVEEDEPAPIETANENETPANDG